MNNIPKISVLSRGLRFLIRVMGNLLNPKAIAWRNLKNRFPDKAIIAKLGKTLKVRIYPYDVIGKEIYVKGMFEKAESLLVYKLLKPGMVFMDIGANLGQYTLIAADSVGPEGQVHSFEPNVRMFGELAFNVELNKLSSRCTLNQIAVSDHEGYAKLSLYKPGHEVYGSIGTQQEGVSEVVGYESVRTTTLDSYITKYFIKHVDLLKMDIEGAELPALKGADKLLIRDDGPIIIIEIADINTAGFGYKAVELLVHLEKMGYQAYVFDAGGRLHEIKKEQRQGTIAINAIALKNSHRKARGLEL